MTEITVSAVYEKHAREASSESTLSKCDRNVMMLSIECCLAIYGPRRLPITARGVTAMEGRCDTTAQQLNTFFLFLYQLRNCLFWHNDFINCGNTLLLVECEISSREARVSLNSRMTPSRVPIGYHQIPRSSVHQSSLCDDLFKNSLDSVQIIKHGEI